MQDSEKKERYGNVKKQVFRKLKIDSSEIMNVQCLHTLLYTQRKTLNPLTRFCVYPAYNPLFQDHISLFITAASLSIMNFTAIDA